jgi:hypothetical protein
MGTLFVLLFWIVMLAILSCILGGIALVISYLFVRKKQFKGKKGLLILVSLSPMIFIGLELIIGFISFPIVSERYKVDTGIGDYWQAPINDYYYLFAIDLPETARVESYNIQNQSIHERILHLWNTNDTTIVLTKNRSMFLFQPHASAIDTIVYEAEQQYLDEIMAKMNLLENNAITPEEYFTKTQQEAHKIERVIRHGIVILVLMLLWGGLFYYIKKNKQLENQKASID